MIGNRSSEFERLPKDVMIHVNRLCNEFEQRWRRGEQTKVEDVLAEVEDALSPTLLNELLPIEITYRRRAGITVSIDQYVQRFPNVARDRLAAMLRVTDDRWVNDTVCPAPFPTRLGDYTIVRPIGSGGAGTVFEAYHELMGRTVAIKVLRPELAFQPQTTERFLREIRAAARLSHPNIVAAYDSREENGIAYLVTEFVDGMNLNTLVKQRGPLPIAEAIEIVSQAACGLQYAHEQGVVHRDIKPQNLMVQLSDAGGTMKTEPGTESSSSGPRPSASVKILDLGLARLRSDELSELTTTNMVMGTAAYMAPEQAMRPKEVDHRADIYSLGCTFYYLLTGRPVYAGDTVLESALAHANEPVPTLSDLSPYAASLLDPIIGRMLTKSPAQRFQSMAAVIAELSAVAILFDAATGSPGPADFSRSSGPDQPYAEAVGPLATSAAGAMARTPRDRRRSSTRRHVLAMGGSLALLAAGALGIAVWYSNRITHPDVSHDSPPRNLANAETSPTADRRALSFNGKSSFAEVASPGFAGEPVTLEAIVTVRATRIAVVIVWFHEGWHAGLGLNLDGRWSLGHCRAVTDGKNSYFASRHAHTTEQVPVHQRIHLAAVFNGEELRLFVDGEQRKMKLEGATATTGGLKRIYIGRGPPVELEPTQSHPDRFFNGLIHAVRISQSVRYTGNFKPPEVLDAEPGDDSILVFDFEEGAENEAHDVLGRATARIIDAEWAPY